MKRLILTDAQADLIRDLLKTELLDIKKQYKKPSEIMKMNIRSHDCALVIGQIDKTRPAFNTVLQLINEDGDIA